MKLNIYPLILIFIAFYFVLLIKFFFYFLKIELNYIYCRVELVLIAYWTKTKPTVFRGHFVKTRMLNLYKLYLSKWDILSKIILLLCSLIYLLCRALMHTLKHKHYWTPQLRELLYGSWQNIGELKQKIFLA